MTFVFGILIGLAAGLAFRRLRARELSRAFLARDYLLAVAESKVNILARELVRRDQAIANIKALAIRAHVDRFLNLGGSVSLPDPVRRTRQISTDRIQMENRIAGPSFDGPHFSGR